MSLPEIYKAIQAFLTTESGRVIATVIVGVFSFLFPKLVTRYFLKNSTHSTHRNLEKLVYAKNVAWIFGLVAVSAIWASKIAGIVLSLAAVFGGVLIVSKELIMCFLGYGFLTVSRSYRTGDFIEIGAIKGRVIDIDMFSTTVSETGIAHQITGTTMTVPNSVLLSQPVRNVSATGKYVLNLLEVALPFDVDFELAERCALAAADKATQQWLTDIESHLDRIEDVAFVDLPSAQPKVLWLARDHKYHTMVIRFGCPMLQRVTVEQEIFRQFWLEYRKHTADTLAGTED